MDEQTNGSPAGIFLVDPDPAAQDTIREIAESVGLDVFCFTSAIDFLESCGSKRPACLVHELRLPDMSGLLMLETLQARGCSIPSIVLATDVDVSVAVRAMKAGAIDVLEKPIHASRLLESVQFAIRQDAEQEKNEEATRPISAHYATLTARERETMALLIAGLAGKQIAAEMGISYKTVERHRASIFRKMKSRSLAKLVLMGVTIGLTDEAPPDRMRENPNTVSHLPYAVARL